MTQKLFWLDSYQTEFTAAIQDQFSTGSEHAIILDRTCFYATSGGQPYDTGTINDEPVKDVMISDGKLLHIVSSPLPAGEVTGKVDWSRRFDHMQQHSGQHILSAAFYRLFEAETSSFHLGLDNCTIELNKPGLTETQIRKAEELANQIVSEAMNVHSVSVNAEEAKKYPLRKQSDLTEALRIIQIGDFDYSPCSGTHVRNSAEVGTIFVYGFEKLSQTIKVEFLCGNRVRTKYSKDLSILKSVSKALTTSFEMIPESVNKMQNQLKEMKKEINRWREEKLKEEAQALYENAPVENQKRFLFGNMKRPYSEVRTIAQSLVEKPDVSGALASTEDHRIVFFKGRGMDYDLKRPFQKFLASTGAKGGGPPHFMEAGSFELNSGNVENLRKMFEE